ncbi:unnamed protein product [Amoebophrya sp. A120]|nr:unnamed protein product [Amoebophrya sp. A120]|eukprot:GSA120T00005289001.1
MIGDQYGAMSRPTLLETVDHRSDEGLLNDHLYRLRADIDIRTRRLEQERRRLCDLEEGVAKCRREFETRRTRYQKLKHEYEGKAGTEHGQERLLETLFQKLNLLHHKDSEYVGTITKLRQERKKVDGIFKQLKQDIQTQTRELIRATHVYEQAQGEKEEMLAQTRCVEKRMKEQRKEFKDMVQNMREDYAKQERIQRALQLRQQRATSATARSNRLQADSRVTLGPGAGRGGKGNNQPALPAPGPPGAGNNSRSTTTAAAHGAAGVDQQNRIPVPPNSLQAGGSSSSTRGNYPAGHHKGGVSPSTRSILWKKKHAANLDISIPEEERQFDAQVLCRRIFRNAFFNAIQRRRIRQYTKNIEIFDQAFDTIRTLTGIQNLEEIVRIFTEMEDRSYSLLTYVNTLHADIEQLEVANKQALDHIYSARHRQNSPDLGRKKALLRSLESKIHQEEAVVLEKEADIQRGLDIISKVRDPLQKTVEVMGGLLFEALKLPEDYNTPTGQRLNALTTLTKQHEQVHDSALIVPIEGMHILENMHEHPVQELLNFVEHNLLHFRDYMASSAPLRILNKPAIGKAMRKPQDLPTAKLEDSDTEGDEMPMSRAELRLAVEKSIHARKKKRA